MLVVPRLLLFCAGLVGATGVAAAAAASHGESRNLTAIATVFLAHAPTLLALALLGRGRLLLGAGGVLAVGTAIFGADLALREWVGHALFAGAAPLGGGAMILGWLGLVLGGIIGFQPASINKD